MSAAGILLMIAGIWILSQVLGGGLLDRLGVA